MEIERRWFVEDFPPEGMFPLTCEKQTAQGYISTKPVVRIRESMGPDGTKHVLCFKGAGTLAREEIETDIDDALFARLKAFIGAPLITKRWRAYALPGGLTLEVSRVDEGQAGSFCYAEVEFDSVEAAHAFVPPPYLADERTEDTGFSMSSYWTRTRGAK